MITIIKKKSKKGGVLDNVYSDKMRQEYLNTLDNEWINIPFNLNLYKIEISGIHIMYTIIILMLLISLFVGQNLITLTDNNLLLSIGLIVILSMGGMILISLLLEGLNRLVENLF